jgi:DNA-directed RNA polymerase subunit K/omega
MADDVQNQEPEITDETPEERPKAEPIESRFLFVDIAAMRAKQLRRGALVRLSDQDDAYDPNRAHPHKAERVAMEEVRRGLVLYEVLPTPKTPLP